MLDPNRGPLAPVDPQAHIRHLFQRYNTNLSEHEAVHEAKVPKP